MGLTTGGMTVDCALHTRPPRSDRLVCWLTGCGAAAGPHRERRGYGGDGHTSYQFALANFPVGKRCSSSRCAVFRSLTEAAATGAYFNKWTRDFADATGASTLNTTTVMPLCSTPGACWVPNTAPTVSGGGGPAWSGFVVTNPWQTYNTYGDVDILADMYPTMESLLAFYASATQPADGLVHCFGHPCGPVSRLRRR